MEFCVLGPLQVLDGPRPVTIGGPRRSGVLAMLITMAGRTVSMNQLVDGVWGDSPPPAVRNQIQVHVSNLRQRFARHGGRDVIVTGRGGYLMRADPAEIDVVRFYDQVDRSVRELDSGRLVAASATCRQALALWRGDALSDVPGPFAEAEANRLEQQRLATLQVRLTIDITLGRYAAVVPELVQLARLHPLREDIHECLMVALYESGRAAQALDVFRTVRTRLSTELGIEPSPRLAELQRAILDRQPGQPFVDRLLSARHPGQPVLTA